MKKTVLLFTIFAAFVGMLQAQDTIHIGDPWYHFEYHDYAPPTVACVNVWPTSASELRYLAWEMVMGQYLHIETVKEPSSTIVYGIALTCRNYPNIEEWTPKLGLFTNSMQIVDSLWIGSPSRFAKFAYEQAQPSASYYALYDTSTFYTDCYEFYFDNPFPVDSVSNPFYVSHYYSPDVYRLLHDSLIACGNLAGIYNFIFGWLLPGGLHDYVFCSNNAHYPFDHPVIDPEISPLNIYSECWGGVFPIIRLRCVSPEARLVERIGDSAATVGWRCVEGGEVYQLSVGDFGTSPDDGTIVTVPANDDRYTFDSLSPDVYHSVWVRKACRYTTPGYDTLVWSDWGLPVTFRTNGGSGSEGIATASGCDFAVGPNPAHGSTRVTLSQEAAAGTELTLCDLQGRALRRYSLQGASLTLDLEGLPAGVYLLHLVAPDGMAIRRLVVE